MLLFYSILPDINKNKIHDYFAQSKINITFASLFQGV